MTGTIHKLSAGTGYEYLTRQVAAMDATDKGKVTLADYYSAKGESPGRWLGSGLAGLADTSLAAEPADAAAARAIDAGDVVSADQMKALFGEGRHPNADVIQAAHIAVGSSKAAGLDATRLGSEFGDYTKQPDFVVALAERFGEHNEALGERWDAPIDPELRAELRTALATERFVENYQREPRDDRELSSFLVSQTRKKQNAVAGYDMTFTPVKSVSTLWAIAPLEISAALEECHDKAVADALAFVERQACLSRLGTDGVAQVDTDGIVAAAFTHRDSRAGDPNLHTHVTISNKVRVRDMAGGYKWMALDGRPLFKGTVTASEVYNSRMEVHCAAHDKLGLRFSEKTALGADSRKRPIREIDGIPTQLMEEWSSRRTAIKKEIAVLSKAFQNDHGREPTASEAYDLAQQATLSTRAAKHEPRSLAEQRQSWRAEAEAVLGGPDALAALVAGVTGTAAAPSANPGLTDALREQFAATAISTVSATRARWQRPHLRAEAERQLRTINFAGLRDDAAITAAVESIVDTALDDDHAIAVSSDALDGEMNEPEVLRRKDGSSVYTTHDSALFTNDAILSAERRIVAASRRTDARRIDGSIVDIALLEQAANGRELNVGQADMVRQLATAGRRVHPVIAPAGTGKTTAMATLAAAWTDSGGTIIGLAPTAAAAKVLEADLGVKTDTLAKLVHLVDEERFHAKMTRLAKTPRWKTVRNSELRAEVEQARAGLADGTIKAPKLPDWYRALDKTSLLIIDEAGMAGTADLDVAISHILSVGGKVCPVGDDQQLASISAGGVLRDIAYETGALTLTQVMRFSDAAEGAASLAVRDGDAAGLGYYADHGRIHVAADDVAADQAYTAWATDRADGRDTHMLAATRETVNELNARARTDRLAANPSADRAAVGLSDGLHAGVGDIICTRRNKRELRISATDWVRNGDRWVVTAIGADGSLTAQHLDLHRTIAIPATYVADNVTLGYASTIHGAQGLTADTCHVVGSDMLTRQLLYVAMTRGRHGNHVYFSTAETDPHKVTTPKAVSPNTGLEVLAAILDRDETQQSATTSTRMAADPFTRLQRVAGTYVDAVGAAAEHTLGAEALAALEADADRIYAEATGAAPNTPALSEAPAWPTLRKHLATIEIDGGTARKRLRTAITSRELDTAADVAAVLDWRLDTSGAHSGRGGPLSWQPGIPKTLAADDTWGPYLSARAERVTDLAEQVRATATGWSIADAPRWARPFVAAATDADTTLVADLAVFRVAMGVSEVDRRPTGPDHPMIAVRKTQKKLTARAAAVVDTASAPTRWRELAVEVDRHIITDPYWPELAEHLSVAARAGLDVHTLVRSAVPADNPLPTEMPAAALWFRLATDLAPASVEVAGTGQRPDWINELPGIVGDRAAEAIIADPAWPGLITAVAAADPTHWTPAELLTVAHDMLDAADDGTVRLDEYARLLTWRIDLLARDSAAAYDTGIPDEPLSPDDEEAAAVAAGLDDPDGIDPDTAIGDIVEPDTAVDVDYLDALASADAPPDYDYEPEPDYAADIEPELAFTDFIDDAPVGVDRFAPPVDIAAAIADRYELTARLGEATAARDDLAAQITDNRGPHTLAAASHIIAMRAHLDHQRPAAGDAATAHTELLAAQDRLADLTATAADLRSRADTLRAAPATTPTAPVHDLDVLDSPDITALRLDADATILDMRITAARADVDAFAADYADAQGRLAVAIAESGGQLVTAADVDAVARAADGLDTDNLNELRQTVADLKTRLWRIEVKLTRHHVTTETAHLDRATTLLAPDTAPRPVTDPAIAALRETITTDPVRALSDRALADAITTARIHVRNDTSDAMIRPQTPVTATRPDHAELVERITTARAAATALGQARAAAADARAALERGHQQLGAVKRRDKQRLTTELGVLIAATHEHTAAVTAAEVHAHDTADAVGAPESQWDALLTTPATPPPAPAPRPTLYNPERARSNSQRLEQLTAEHRRRTELAAPERSAEDAIRAELHDDSPEPTTAPEASYTAPTPEHPGAAHGVDQSYDRGL